MTVHHELSVGRDFYLAGEYDKAEPHLLRALRQNGAFADVHNMLGVIRFHRGNLKAAQRSFERALTLNSTYTEAAAHLTVCYNELGEYEKAATLAMGDGSDTDTPSPLAQPQLDSFARGKLANLHKDLAESYRSLGMLDRAAEEFRKALDWGPDYFDIRVRLASLLHENGQSSDARGELTRLLDGEPNYVPAHIQLGILAFSAGDKAEARASWMKARRLDPENAAIDLYLAMLRKNTRAAP